MASANHPKQVISRLQAIYSKLPINFSTITGLRYPGIPRLKGNFLLGRLPVLFKDNGALNNVIAAAKLAEKHPSGMCYFWVGKQLSLLLTKPEDVKALKVTHETHLARDVPLMSKAAGDSIITNDRDTWQKKRAVCNKFMGYEAVVQLKAGMDTVIDRYMAALTDYVNRPIELRTFLFNLVEDVVSKNLMGCQAQNNTQPDKPIQIEQPSELCRFLTTTMQDVFQLYNIFKSMLPSFIRRLFFRNATDIASIRYKLQQEYYQTFLAPNQTNILATHNLLKDLWEINQAKANRNGYDAQYINGEGLLLLIASIATTVVTLEFIIKLLAAHPDAAEKLQQEIHINVTGDSATLEAIKNMPYLDMVIKESLRLYPPAPILMPRAIDSYVEINGIPLYKGDVPIFSPYVMHRSKQYWHQPDEFIPERFSKENQHAINLNAYFPFSIGPRFCAGQPYAMQEMKLILIALYRKHRVTIQNNSFAVTLKQGGLSAAAPPIATICPA